MVGEKVRKKHLFPLNPSRKTEVGRQKSEVGRQKSEVGRQKSEDRSQKTEVRSRKTEVGRQKSEDRRQKSEDRSLFSVTPFWFEKAASRRGRPMCLPKATTLDCPDSDTPYLP